MVGVCRLDIAGLELYLPIISGGKVVIVPRDTAIDGARLAKSIEHTDATVMQATPATWRMLLEADWEGKSDLTVLCGGEAMPPNLVQDLDGKCAALWNMYGPTETTIWSSVNQVRSGIGPVPIGRPIANTTYYILDAHWNLAPIGVPGELYIGGEGLAWGYQNHPDLTAEKFVPNPFSNEENARLYRTSSSRDRGC